MGIHNDAEGAGGAIAELAGGRVLEMMQEYTLWQYARMARDRRRWVMGLLEGRAVRLKTQFGSQDLWQLHQCMLSSSSYRCFDESPCASRLQLWKALGSACQNNFVKSEGHPLESHQGAFDSSFRHANPSRRQQPAEDSRDIDVVEVCSPRLDERAQICRWCPCPCCTR